MIAQAAIVNGANEVLMVRQLVARGDVVWNFPGGGVVPSETPEEACVREVKEETGFDIRIIDCLCFENLKYTFRAEIVGDGPQPGHRSGRDGDILEVRWVGLGEDELFDAVTRPIRNRLCG